MAEAYSLTPVQADAILRMTLGQLVNLEQEKLVDEHRELLEEIAELPGRSWPTKNEIYAMIREDLHRYSSESMPIRGARRSAVRRSATSTSKT